MATTEKHTITIDIDTYKDFSEIAKKNGVKLSTWVTQKMREYIESEGK